MGGLLGNCVSVCSARGQALSLFLQSDVRIRMAEARFSEEKAKMQQKLEQTVRKVCTYIHTYVCMSQPSLSCSPGTHTGLLT